MINKVLDKQSSGTLIKPPANLTVYKASAGSGKTFTLATEYIALLVSKATLTSMKTYWQ